MPEEWSDEDNLRYRIFDYDEYWREASMESEGVGDIPGLEDWRQGGVCAGGKYQLYGRGQDLGRLEAASQADELAYAASENDTTYIVPAFTGLGAPYWDTDAKAMIYGMGRQTGRAELVRAVDECIAYQVTDIVKLMEEESGFPILEVRADGGASRGEFLMHFQSDLLNVPVYAAENEEISGTGAGLAAGFGLGFYDDSVFEGRAYREYTPEMDEEYRRRKYDGWKDAVKRVLLK